MGEKFVKLTAYCLSGPLLWSVHFGLLYGVQHVVCHLSQQQIINYFELFAWFTTFLIVVGIWLSMHRFSHFIQRESASEDSDTAQAEDHDIYPFVHRVAYLGAVLATVAVLWSMFAVLFLPEC